MANHRCLLGLAAVLLACVRLSQAGYDQWIDLTLENRGRDPLHVKGELSWGKWYRNGDKSKEASEPNQELGAGQSMRIAATGRADSSSGTTGQLLISRGGQQVVRVEFDVPWSGRNMFRVVVLNDETTSTSSPGWSEGGALGELKLRIFQQ